MDKAYSYIRMSTEVQLKGDSRRRQLEASRRYAEEKGLELVENFEDIGVSAFKGANTESGALKGFLDAVAQGKIPRGSYLLMESLDRLTRQSVNKALPLLMQLLNDGIKVVTLFDDHIYEDSSDPTGLMYSLMVMSRAHDESVTKSRRGTAAWSKKRQGAKSDKLTAKCPSWLELADDRSEFTVVEDRDEIVQRIFELADAGLGSLSISKRLNEEGVPAFGRGHGWQTSGVSRILNNRAVLGEFQPHRMVGKRRVTEGEPIINYYPRVVDPKLFLRVQQARAGRASGAGGRRGTNTSNLFSRLAECAYCGARMHYVNKGPPPKGGSYLVCSKGRRGLSCSAVGWRYSDFESSFLAFVHELDLESLVSSADSGAQSRASLETNIRTLDGEIAQLEAVRERTFQLVADSSTSAEYLRRKLDEHSEHIEAKKAEKAAAFKSLQAELADVVEIGRTKTEVKGLIDKLRATSGNDVLLTRARIARQLATIVSSLQLMSSGKLPKVRETIQILERERESHSGDLSQDPELEELIATFRRDATSSRAARKCFLVGLKDGTVRVIYPDPRDPLKADEQIVRSGGRLARFNESGVEVELFPHLTNSEDILD